MKERQLTIQSMTRRRFLAYTGGAACALAAGAQDHSSQRPNIVLLMGDDHGWDETGYNGHPHLKTPVMDEMAATGLRLDRFYSAAPVCSPTRGSVITGRHPNRYGTFSANWSIRPEEASIARILGDAGYACGHFGKWHLGPVKAGSPTNPGAMGFDEWLSHDNFFEMDPYLSRNGGPPEQFQGESSEIIIDEAMRFIDKAQQQGKNFFVVVWYGSPHQPYKGLEKDNALYDDLPDKYAGRNVGVTSFETGRSVERPLPDVLKERYAEITAMDRSMGRLREHLAGNGLRKDTMLWYCGDNGVPRDVNVTSPFRGRKGHIYEGGVRVPGLIEWPAGVPEPRVSDVNTVTSDMLPTLCELAGQPLPERTLDGISLKPLLDGTMPERPEPICFWSYNSRREPEGREPYIAPELQVGTTPLVKLMAGKLTRTFRNVHHPEIAESDYEGPRAILDNQYKLVIHGDRRELFDVREDPGEEKNLIEAHAETAGELERKLRTWQESVLKSLTGADYPQSKD